MSRLPPCPQCGSTVFTEQNGLYSCDNGHQQEGGPRIGEDDGDFGTAGKISRKKDVKNVPKVSRIYRGKEGYKLFLQAWQLVLWKQCYVLIHKKSLPEELWAIVRELWVLRLRLLQARLDPNIIAENDESAGLMTESESAGESETKLDDSKRGKIAKNSPTLSDTVATAYIGILLLRRPISLASIYKSIRNEELCYIRAIRHIPQDMKERLDSEYHAALDTTVVLDQYGLQSAVLQVARLYETNFGMEIPPINWKLLLFERIKLLALPLEVFSFAKYIVTIVRYTFTYSNNTKGRRNAVTLPEAQLIAVILVATKLLFPFNNDDFPKHVVSTSEPAATRLDWNLWLKAHDEYQGHRRSTEPIEPGKEIEITDKDVMELSNDQLDRYMDWFQSTYAKDTDGNALRKQVLDMFPVANLPAKGDVVVHNSTTDEEEISNRLKMSQAGLQPQNIISEQEVQDVSTTSLYPGQRYQQFRTVEELKGAPLALHTEAAELACLPLNMLLRAILHTERLLLLHQHEVRRAQVFGEENADSDSDETK